MKSLEHIIREIREGKAEKGSKKTLEGSIRKVMKGEKESSFADRTTKPITDDVGGLAGSGTGGEPKLHAEAIGSIGTDDYQGNQFKSVRTATPHIKPPAGPDGHSQAPENASRQRTLAKERGSMTMHGKVAEGYKEKIAEPIIKGVEDLFKLAPVAPEAKLPAVVTPKGVPTKPKAGLPAKVEPKEVPAKVEPKPEVKTKTDTETKTQLEIPSPSKTKPAELPAVDAKVATKEKPAELPAVDAKVATKEKPAELPAVEPKTAVELPKAAPPKTGKGLPFIPPFIGGSASAPTKEPFDYRSKKVPVASKAHHAKRPIKEDTETRKKIENMPRPDAGDRKSIEYVGRKGSDPKSVKQKTSRLAIIKNVIDEAKKIKFEAEFGKEKKYVYPNETEVVIGPNMKRNFLDVDDKLPKDYDSK